ncbi:MAG: Gfo/Idh/MocA family oxidoreductase [Planctomycetota bacterium]
MGRHDSRHSETLSRRDFLARTAALAVGTGIAAPLVLPSTAFGKYAPSNRITLGCIGTGRIARTDDLPEFLALEGAQVVAVCDVDSKRRRDAKEQVDRHYAARFGKASYAGCAEHHDFRELVARDDIDAVLVCTPDHWHAIPVVAAAKAGKDIFVQKPLSLTIAEGRAMSDAVHRHGRVFLVGSQQRSDARFRQACELVRNGRIGELKTVKVGLPADPGCGEEAPMPVPPNLDYEMWLGQAPWAPYTEKRVHPQDGYGRPGWLRLQAYGAGMITGWGSHHLDIAQWGMGTEHTGPVSIEGTAVFPASGLWDVHGEFYIEFTYASGVKVICADEKRFRLGVRFEGTEGSIFVTRGEIAAEPPALLDSVIGPEEIHLYASDDHKRNFLDCVRSRALTVAPVEVAHRSCTVCLLGGIAMKLSRRLRWDPDRERFRDDDEANSMLSRPMRLPWRLE